MHVKYVKKRIQEGSDAFEIQEIFNRMSPFWKNYFYKDLSMRLDKIAKDKDLHPAELEFVLGIRKEVEKFRKNKRYRTPREIKLKSNHRVKVEIKQLKHGKLLNEVIREAIVEALKICKGNQTQAAELLGMSVKTLRSKIDQFNCINHNQ